MKGHLILLDHIGDLEAAARFEGGRLEDLLIDDPDRPRPGAIYRAICDRPLKGQGGMIVRLPDGSGFLRQGKGLAPGQPILVQVTGYAEDGKAVPVTQRLLFKSRYCIVTPDAPGINVSRSIKDEEQRIRLRAIGEDSGATGLILRSAAEMADDDALADDIAAMVDLCAAVMGDADGQTPEALTEGDGPHGIAWREWTDPAQVDTQSGCFDHHDIATHIEDLRRGVFKLDQGWMSVEPTRALVAVDINTGGDTSPAAGLKANLAAMRRLPAALRLMGLGGQVVVDMAPMTKAQRRQMESAFRQALKTDPIETNTAGWTPLGNLEIQRKRERRPLHELPL